VLQEFPQTPSGKIQKFVLRERFLAQGSDVAILAKGPDGAAAACPPIGASGSGETTDRSIP
jgi:hypothetical protein